MEKYRMVEGYGPYLNKRYEVQEKYTYYDADGNKIQAWHMVYHSTDKESCEKVLEKYLTMPKKDFRIDELIF